MLKSFNPYNWKKKENAYHFITDNGIEYTCVFIVDETVQYLGIEVDQEIRQFSFFPNKHLTIKDRIDDIRINQTIVSVVIDFFKRNPESILIYFCLDDDRKALSRHRLFKRWIKQYNSPPLKRLYSFDVTDSINIGLLLLDGHKEIEKISSIYDFQVEELDANDKSYTTEVI